MKKVKLRGWSKSGGGLALLASLAIVLMLSVIPIGAIAAPNPASDKCQDERAEDLRNEESAACDAEDEGGGEDYGSGGDDGASLPHPEDGNSHTLKLTDGHIIHWTRPSGGERKIIVRDHTVDSWTNKLPNAVSDWGASSRFRFTIQQGATDTTTRSECTFPTYYGRVKVCSYQYSWSDAGRARSIVAHDSSQNIHHIQRSWVKLNGRTTTDSQQRSVICHELGHTLGLDHRGVTSSCMYGGTDAFPTSPDQHDYDVLVNQTDSHGGESETGGTDGSLDTGGGIQDGCINFSCTEIELARNGNTIITTRFLLPPPATILAKLEMLR